jgi:hypothetical protein
MTKRQRIKLKLLIAGRKNTFKNFEDFKRSSLGTLDCVEDADLQAEMDRIETIPMGFTRMLREVWNELEKERLEAESIKRWTAPA